MMRMAKQISKLNILWLSVLLLRGSILLMANDNNIYLEEQTIHVPRMSKEKPAAGRRVRQTIKGFELTRVYHSLYLPKNWNPDRKEKYPVIFEYPGNGPYKNKFGDVCTGRVEDCNLGYGISDGMDFIWVCLPFVSHAPHENQLKWWGDVTKTIEYCQNTIEEICTKFNGDKDKLILAGFSRGSIACNFIGLYNDQIASHWAGFICHSHYDGIIDWGYAFADKKNARIRLKRLNGRPQFISHESDISKTREWLRRESPLGNFTFCVIPYRNHTDSWVLRDIPERKKIRQWIYQIVDHSTLKE